MASTLPYPSRVELLISLAMEFIKIRFFRFAFCLLTLFIFTTVLVTPVSAHGGEDHGDGKAATVSTDKGAVTHTAKVGELEILLKHAPFEPDAAGAARLFVTRFATNEPLTDVAPTIEITAPDGKTYQAEVTKSDSPGAFALALPPLPEGKYTLLARLKFGGETDTATFSNIGVAHTDSDAPANATSYFWNILIGVVGSAVLIAIAAFAAFAVRYAARNATVAPATNKDAVSV